ncbi:MAG: hypothetical protein AB2L14_13930 [Candidatus Xenobiia bacterium LiM19]
MEDDERMTEIFYKTMERTAKLKKHFPDGFDFGLEPFDPMIEQTLELFAAVQPSANISDDKRFVDLIIRSIDDFVSIKTRYDLYLTLEKVKKAGTEKEKDIINAAQEALEDCNLPVSIIALAYVLFAENVLKVTVRRIEMDKERPEPSLLSLAEAVISKSDENSQAELIQKGDDAVKALKLSLADALSKKEEESSGIIRNALKVLSKIPSYHSASVMLELLKDRNLPMKEILEAVQGSPALPYMTSYALYEVGRSDCSASRRWFIYETLFELRDHRIFEFLRSELLASTYWFPESFADIIGSELDFYNHIARMLTELDDRRVIPVFIRFIGSDISPLDEEAKKAVTAVIEQSKWYKETAEAVRSLKDGERIFLEKDTDVQQIVMKEVEEYAAFHKKVTGTEIEMDEMKKKASLISEKLKEAYHDDLDGLRPVDIPVSPLRAEFFERMIDDYRNSLGLLQEAEIDETDGDFREFQSEWELTPLPDHGSETPFVLVMKEGEASADSSVLKDYFLRYRDNEINELYFDAREKMRDGETEKARRRVEAILALVPDHPFADKLKSDIDSAPQFDVTAHARQILIRKAPDTSLKPFMADVVFCHRTGLKEKLEGEIAHLDESRLKAPAADDSHFINRESYMREMLQGYKDEGIPLREDDGSLRTVIGTLEMEYFALFNFKRAGEKVFYISPKLVEKLTATELNVSGSQLAPPCPSCMLIYQDPHVIQLFHHCFSDSDIISEYSTPVSVSVTESGEGAERALIIITARMSSDFCYYGIMRKRFPLRDSESLEDTLQGESEDFEAAFFRIVLNSLLYLSSKNRDQKPEKSPIVNLEREIRNTKSPRLKKKMEESLARKMEECSAYPYVTVGASLKKSRTHNVFIQDDITTWSAILKSIFVKGQWSFSPSGREAEKTALVWSEPEY